MENFPRGSFYEILHFRQTEARKSILVQLDMDSSTAECKRYCEKYGKIAKIFHYMSRLDAQNFVLVEFESNFSVEEIRRTSAYMSNFEYIPIQTTVLWYRDKLHLNKSGNVKQRVQLTNEIPRSSILSPSFNLIKENLHSLNSVTEQVHMLHRMLSFTDLDVRLRFYTANQLELCFSSLFPTISVVPFGSSVNGFGLVGCDLDLVCKLNNKKGKTDDTTQKLVFQSKPYAAYERQDQREFLSILAHIMHKFIPGISNVNKILQARVPIIKFTNKCTSIHCDLSSTQMVALYMSEVLYIYGEIDPRVKPLVCTIRKWAKCHYITTDTSGQWITNFSLTLLIIFYFQLKGILPSLNKLGEYARFSSSNGTFDVEFIACVKRMQAQTGTNTESLHALLYGFFAYYATFDFTTRAICIREGRSKLKRDNAPLHILNPFEPTLNVSKNVTAAEIVKIKAHVRTALLGLEKDGPQTIVTLLGLIRMKQSSKPTLKSYDLTNVSAKDVSKPVKNAEEENGDRDTESVQSELVKDEFLTDENSFDDSDKLKEIIK
ncbi:mitochondrial poly(A) polymerase isoform X2 [Andrena cerasifolii]